MGIEQDRPYFEIQGKRIFAIHDPPHLLKTLRRNWMKYDIKSSKGLACFKHVIDFYEFDKTLPRRCAPKLTDQHVYAVGIQSMKVALASQIFSNSVAAGMTLCMMANKIDIAAEPTIDLIGKMNDLFDSMNGFSINPLRGKTFHCIVKENSPHIEFWKQLSKEIEDWIFLPKNSVNEPAPKRQIKMQKCQQGWILTLNSMILLYEDLRSQGYEYLIPRRLNQDCLENFFSTIRGSGGHNRNPSALQFHSNFKMACFKNCSTKKHFTNCDDDDDDNFCIDLISSTKCDIKCSENELYSSDKDEYDDDDGHNNINIADEFDYIEKNVIYYLAGYVAKRSIEKSDCPMCLQILTDKNEDLSQFGFYTYFKEYSDEVSGLIYPSENMVNAIQTYMNLIDSVFTNIMHKNNILKKMESLFREKCRYSIYFIMFRTRSSCNGENN